MRFSLADVIGIIGLCLFLGIVVGGSYGGSVKFKQGYTEGYQARIDYEHGK